MIRLPVIVALLVTIGCTGTLNEEGAYRPNRAIRCGVPGAAPGTIRRLTADQYELATERLFPGVDLPPVELPAGVVDGGFANNATAQGVGSVLIEQFSTQAQSVAIAAVGQPGWMPCRDANLSCYDEMATYLGTGAYRRSLTDEERTAFRAFLMDNAAGYGFDGAVAMLIEAMLQTPQFLYLPEVGDRTLEAPSGMVALRGPELATRLSFFLWNEPPSEDLIARAESGALDTAEGLQAEAEVMLDDPKAREALDEFFGQWLRLDRLESASIDPNRYPELTDEVRADLRESTLRFLRHVFWEEGSLQAMFTSRRGYVNDRLAPIFGVAPPGTDELVAIELPAEQRAGLLTQPGVLASTSHGTTHSPILRGVLVLDAVLCDRPPPPPADVVALLPEEDLDMTTIRTTRERVESLHGTGACATCHEAIDGMGFSFERYDAIGRFRTEENGETVDPTGNLRGEPVEDAVELSGLLAADRGTETCMITQWYRYAMGRIEEDQDLCQIQELSADLREQGDDLRSMVLSLVTSNAFRFRPNTQ